MEVWYPPPDGGVVSSTSMEPCDRRTTTRATGPLGLPEMGAPSGSQPPKGHPGLPALPALPLDPAALAEHQYQHEEHPPRQNSPPSSRWMMDLPDMQCAVEIPGPSKKTDQVPV